MCVVITCEAGGERLPDWLIPDAGSNPNATEAANPSLPSDNSDSLLGGLLSGSALRSIASSADLPGRDAAVSMAHQLDADLIVNEYAHDLIDVTRTPGQRGLFSNLTHEWPRRERERLVSLIHRPYVERVRAAVEAARSKHGFVIHLSIRSFDLRHRGKIFRTDVGLLYDPARPSEADLCLDWIDQMWDRVTMLKVRRNYPRRGSSNGLMQSLRAEYGEQEYLGVEVWLNRAWVQRKVAIRESALEGICESLAVILDGQVDDLGEDDGTSQVQAA
jgi:hypothetical protein